MPQVLVNVLHHTDAENSIERNARFLAGAVRCALSLWHLNVLDVLGAPRNHCDGVLMFLKCATYRELNENILWYIYLYVSAYFMVKV